MSQVTYQNAFDENGKRIHISEVEPATHLGRIFKCISCGEDLIAKIGNQEKAHSKAPHFAHKHNCACNTETYLHKLGKMLFKERFESGKPINIKCPTYEICSDSESCPLYSKERCRGKTESSFNIREWYDTCSEEKEYNGFRADLLLESSKHPERPPLFLEIVYSHKCSNQKINSKNKIIEIKALDENQLTQVINRSFRANDIIRIYNFEVKETAKIEQGQIQLEHFKLFTSGKVFVSQISCRDVKTINNHNTEIEFVINKPWTDLVGPSAYNIGFVLALDAGCDVRNCWLCKYHDIDAYALSSSERLYCKLTHKLSTPSHPSQTEAKTCQYFRKDEKMIAETRNMMSKIKYWKLPCSPLR